MHPFLRGLLDLLYPPRCQVCHRFAPEPFCPECLAAVTLIRPPVCCHCGTPLDPMAQGPDECAECRSAKRTPISRVRSAGVYQGPLRQAILALKFGGKRALALPLAKILAELYLSGLCKSSDFDCVCPVPLDRQRQRERGFNQAQLLARYFSETVGLPLRDDLLQRVRPTLPQAMLPTEQRSKNVRGAFALTPHAEVKDARVLLVDDVYTTGSTLKECARILRQGGATEVCVITLARPRPAWMPEKE